MEKLDRIELQLRRIAWAIEREFRDSRDDVYTCESCGHSLNLKAWPSCRVCGAKQI